MSEQGGDVVHRLGPELLGEGRGPGGVDVRCGHQGDVVEARQDRGVPRGDAARPDEAEAQNRIFRNHARSVP
jgi:hypothetical protein